METAIMIPARSRTAGLLAGGLLLLAAASAHAQLPQPDAAQDAAGTPRSREAAKQAPDGTRKRPRLDARIRQECSSLGATILESEKVERRANAGMIDSVQQDLLSLRKRYRKLGC
jgi:hypothetical protein